MKKILSMLLALSMLLSAAGVSFAQNEPYSETGYTFKLVSSLTNSGDGIGRTFGVAVYTMGDKTYAYLGQQYGLKAYDITDLANPVLIQDANHLKGANTAIFNGDIQYPMEVHNGNLYFSNGSGPSLSTYVFPINEDGTLDLPVKKNADNDYYSLDTGKMIQNNRRAMYGMSFFGNDLVTLKHFGSTNWGGEAIDIIDVTENKLPAPASIETAGFAFNINAIQKADGQYRICYVSTNNTDSSTAQKEGAAVFNIVDYDPETKGFTEVYSGILQGADWAETVGAYFKCSPPQFLSETRVALSYGQDQPKTDPEKVRNIYIVDFSDLGAVTVDKVYASDSDKDGGRLSWLTQFDDKLILWNKNTSMIDPATGEILSTFTPPESRVCDVKHFDGDKAAIALDGTVCFYQIEKSTLAEEDTTMPSRVIKLGEPASLNLVDKEGAPLRAAAMTTAQIGGKTFAYIKNNADNGNTGDIYAYDVTDPANMRPLVVDAETQNPVPYSYGFRSYGSEMFVKDGYLFVADTGGFKWIKIHDDGALETAASTAKIDVGANAISQAYILGDYLFAVSNGGNARMFDISAVTSPNLITTFSSAARGMAVEQLSSLRYRVYVAEIQKTADNQDDTVKFRVFEVLRTLKEVKIEELFADVPNLDTVNAWPGRGIFGQDSSVTGYIEYAPVANCSLHVVGKGLVRYSAERLSKNNRELKLSYDDILIDTSDPAAPRVVAHIEKDGKDWTPRQIKIDENNFLQQCQNGTAAVIVQYPDRTAPVAQYTLEGFNGYTLSVTGNMAYTTSWTDVGALNAIQLYAEGNDLAVSEIAVTDENGNTAADVGNGLLKASATIQNNTGTPVTVRLALAVYDKSTSKMEYVQVTEKTISGFDTISDTIDLLSLSDYSAYTKYVKAFLWNDSMAPLTEAKKVNAKESKDIEFHIWLPEGVDTVKGLMVMHEHGMVETLANLETFRNTLAEMDMGYMSISETKPEGIPDGTPGYFVMKDFQDPEACTRWVLNEIAGFAESTGHPELVNAPLMTIGHSNGNQFAAGLAAQLPERMLGVVLYKPALPRQYELDALAGIPTMLIEGELDDAYGAGLHGHFEAVQRMRQKGALIGYTVDPNAGHGWKDRKSNSIVYPFMQAAYSLRMPADADPAAGAVTLNTVEEADGYIGTIKTTTLDELIKPDNKDPWPDKTYAGTYVPYAEAAHGVWLPTETFAKQWAEFLDTGVVDGIDYYD